jgi:hypothetical protein
LGLRIWRSPIRDEILHKRMPQSLIAAIPAGARDGLQAHEAIRGDNA